MQQVDSFFTKGVSHKVCEDYTMHGNIDGNPYAILCDGCSGSKDTDFGARLLARSARESYRTLQHKKYFSHITEHKDRIGMMEDEIKRTLSSMITATHSELSVADATLLMAFTVADNMYVFARGDGSYAYRNRATGELTMVEIEFPTGAPFYFTYDLHPINQRLYHQQANVDKVIRTCKYDINGNFIGKEIITLPYNEIMYEVLDASKIDFVSLMSDGVSAIQYSGKYMGEKVAGATDVFNIIKQVVAYKNHNGEFVQRRMNRVMRNIEKHGLENFDDVSVATIWMGGAYHE